MADIVTTRVFSDGEKGITASKLNDIVAGSSIQTSFVSSKPTASTIDPADTMLLLKAAGTYAQAPFSTVTNSVAGQLPSSDPEIWSVRLRSLNTIGNPTFEIDQRTAGAGVANPIAGQFCLDRWACGKTGTMVIKVQQTVSGGALVVPGTNFRISANYAALTLTTQQTTLGASDHWDLLHYVEGSSMRELINDVHSLSLLVYTSVANLKFAVTLRDSPATKTLTKLCTIPNASTWTLIPLANLPVWPAGNFVITPGNVGYEIRICLAAGSTATAPAADTWQTGSFFGAPGMDNFASKPVNSTFFVGFVQHEPGSQCSTLIDCPFDQNLLACTRHFQKSYDLAVAPGAISNNGDIALINAATTNAVGPVRFSRRMCKAPLQMVAYNPVSGAANSMRQTGGPDFAVSSFVSVGETGFESVSATGLTANSYSRLHYTADTGF